MELAVGIAAAVYKNDFQAGMKDLMRSSMDRYGNSKSDIIAWDNLQNKVIYEFFFRSEQIYCCLTLKLLQMKNIDFKIDQ